jgi:hypothetical protein
MNSIALSLGKNNAVLRFGLFERRYQLALAAEGPCNKLVFGEIGGKQKEVRCTDDEPLLVSYKASGFTAYWVVENHDDLEVVRITHDAKANTVVLDLLNEGEWATVSTTDLAVLSNPEFKFYNYRSEVAAKMLNAPKRPRGRPRKTEAADTKTETA